MPSLVSLAEQLLAQAKKLDAALNRNSIPAPSFDEDTLEQLPQEAQQLRWDLLDTSDVIRQLTRGARLTGLDISFSWTDQLILRIIWRYQLAAAVPLHGSATYEEMAAASGLAASVVARAIRAAIPLRIFAERVPGQISHTALSRLLATDEGYASVIGLQLEDIAPASRRLLEIWNELGTDAGDPDQSAFSVDNGGRSLFQVLSEEPARARRFNLAMKYCVEDKDFSFNHVFAAFDWASLDDRPGGGDANVVVDLGGGMGQLSQDLASKTHNLRFTVQDLAHVVEEGRAKVLPTLRERVSFEAHDFLEPQDEPPPNEDRSSVSAFLISRCLHNWSDRHCTRILQGLIPALRAGSKVLIWDTVLDDAPGSNMSDRFGFQQDFIMATISNGKDRTAGEFRQLLAQSDPRFVVESVNKPVGSRLAMVVVSWAG
ncbi:hypothetical protein PWT90_10066 [Aphanocladium album]|nr:hypothetical protein PWT90_10066 [Aphanocladium album]